MTCKNLIFPHEKGGRDAAFFLLVLAVATLGFGGSLQPSLALLRAAGFGAGIAYLWRRTNEGVRVAPYLLLVGGFVLLSLGHAFSSVYVWVSLQHAINIALASLLLFWAAILFGKERDRMYENTFNVVRAIAVVEAAIALYQRFFERDIRPHGTFDNPNFLAEFLAVAAILCLSRVLWAEGSRRRRSIDAGTAGIFLVSALALSSSRGVLVSAVPAFGLLLVCRYGLRKGAAVLAFIGLPVLAIVGWRSADRFFTPDIYNYGRWIIWKSALRTFIEHPFGVGLGGFKYFWYATQSPVAEAFRKYGKFARTAHSEYMEILSGLGAIGFILFLAILVAPLLLAFRLRKEIPESRRWIANAAVAGLVLSGVHAAFDSGFHEFGIVCLDAALLGALLSFLPRTAWRTVLLPRTVVRTGVALCAVLLVISATTVSGAFVYEYGEKKLRLGDLAGAENAFRLASVVDPLRAPYPDAVSGVYYLRYQKERRTSNDRQRLVKLLKETLHWEDSARWLNPRESRYILRLSSLFIELFRIRGEYSDVRMALGLAGEALRINPFSVEALWYRAELFAAIGRPGDAVADLKSAVSIEPNFGRGYSRLAELTGAADPRGATELTDKAKACREKAALLSLEDYEKWLVESPEER
ncbi:MAG: O-antigen ligase family protein [Deltaproteobacteria bacterium]|nr:O-antigen ligase family protein [Deltaproteobacteria bacterium]